MVTGLRTSCVQAYGWGPAQGDVVTWAQEALLVYIYPAAEQQHNL